MAGLTALANSEYKSLSETLQLRETPEPILLSSTLTPITVKNNGTGPSVNTRWQPQTPASQASSASAATLGGRRTPVEPDRPQTVPCPSSSAVITFAGVVVGDEKRRDWNERRRVFAKLAKLQQVPPRLRMVNHVVHFSERECVMLVHCDRMTRCVRYS